MTRSGPTGRSSPTRAAALDHVYRTGDLVQEREDGNFMFLGRRDSQIKSRGYRIELGEIEAALHAHPAVVECAVLAIPDELVTNRIKAAVVLRGALADEELARFCAEKIPAYMVPESFQLFEGGSAEDLHGKDRPRGVAGEAQLTGSGPDRDRARRQSRRSEADLGPPRRPADHLRDDEEGSPRRRPRSRRLVLQRPVPEDHGVVPQDFEATDDLKRSTLDLTPSITDRKLPFVKDIWDRLLAASTAEYLVYTNVDIALMPGFYDRVAELIRDGFDAFAFTRRNIPGRFTVVDEIPEMYVQPGTPQRGPDCFVVRRGLYELFELDDVFVGEPGIGRAILANLIGCATRPGFFTDGASTFHIGNEGAWKGRPDLAGRVNLERSLAIVTRLYREVDDERREMMRPHLEAVERMLRWSQVPLA